MYYRTWSCGASGVREKRGGNVRLDMKREDKDSVPVFEPPKDLQVPDLPMSASTTRFVESINL